MHEPAAPQTRADALRPRARRARRASVAPVAETQAALFRNLDTTFGALASVARPVHPGLDQRAARRRWTPAIEELPAPAAVPRQHRRAVPRAAARRAPRCRPRRRRLADALGAGTARCRGRRRSTSASSRLLPGAADVRRGPARRRSASSDLTTTRRDRSSPTLDVPRAGPDSLQLRDAVLPQHRARCSARATRTAPGSASSSSPTPQGPNNEGGPSSAPGQRADRRHNYLHTNPYPNTAAPGQPQECEAGNEPYARPQDVIGNVPGNQGTDTETTTAASR